MSVPDWLLIVLGLLGLTIAFGMVGHWLAVCLVLGLAAGFALGVWS